MGRARRRYRPVRFRSERAGIGPRGVSWRTTEGEWDQEGPAITFSGDQTSGYDDGSEYFDIDIEAFKAGYPNSRYLVFCDNVYSGIPFSNCLCRAGYMLRDEEDSGQVFEPKTVQSSWAVTCSSTFAYLFAMDLERRDLIWLNMARESQAAVAGTTSMGFLTRYFEVTTDVINVASFFEMMASELVDTPQEADVVVSDEDLRELTLPETTEVIRSNDVERIMALMNA